jgi:hypothetical protein
MNRTWSILLWILGEAILVTGFMYFGQNDNQSQLIINVLVSSTILTVFLMSLFRDSATLSKRGVGKSMKWFFTITYTLLSIAAMLYFDFFNPVDILTQGIVQLIFLSVLVMGMWGAFKPAKKTGPDNKYEKMEQNQLIMIRNVIGVARARAEKRLDIPASMLHSIIELQNDALLISPGNEYVALKMEGRIMSEMNRIIGYLKMQPLDLKELQFSIKRCSKLINEFHDTYSMPHAHQFS